MDVTAAKARSLLATRKSVDVLFRSAADVYNRRVPGVVMPSVGADSPQERALLHAVDDAIGATAR